MNASVLLLIVILFGFAAVIGGCGGAPGGASRPGASVPRIVGHRGASADAPENTLVAFRLAFEQGADAVEGDFWLTVDGRIVAHHDRTLEKSAGIDRDIETMTLDELQEFDVGGWGVWRNGAFTGERIPTLEQVLATLPADRGGIFIELKSDARIVPVLADVLNASGLAPDRITIISFDADTIAAVRNQLPRHRALWIVDFERAHLFAPWSPTIAEVITTARRIGVHGVDLNANLSVLTKDAVTALRDAGLEFHTWTVNDPDTARKLINLGVDSITTDRPGGLRKDLDQSQPRAKEVRAGD